MASFMQDKVDSNDCFYTEYYYCIYIVYTFLETLSLDIRYCKFVPFIITYNGTVKEVVRRKNMVKKEGVLNN